MTVAIATDAPLGPIRWDTIHWPTIRDQVRRLQVRIAKAAGEGDFGKVKALQWILTHSWYAKLWAVRRVTRNKGAKTPGVDGVTWKTGKKKITAALALKRHRYHPQPLRRIYIQKPNGKLVDDGRNPPRSDYRRRFRGGYWRHQSSSPKR
jgi:RNA-directed DNA polymerase